MQMEQHSCYRYAVLSSRRNKVARFKNKERITHIIHTRVHVDVHIEIHLHLHTCIYLNWFVIYIYIVKNVSRKITLLYGKCIRWYNGRMLNFKLSLCNL